MATRRIRRSFEGRRDAPKVELPRQVAGSLEHLRAAISHCDRVSIPGDTLIAAPMTELKTPTFNVNEGRSNR